MFDWIKGLTGDTANPTVIYIVSFLLIVIAIYGAVRIARRLWGGTYVAGGKSRHLRLAVMDATPVDSHRKLVLVRRDHVEHLILIGGPSDIVVEQNIKIANEGPKYQPPVQLTTNAPSAPSEPAKADSLEVPSTGSPILTAVRPLTVPQAPTPSRSTPLAAPVVAREAGSVDADQKAKAPTTIQNKPAMQPIARPVAPAAPETTKARTSAPMQTVHSIATGPITAPTTISVHPAALPVNTQSIDDKPVLQSSVESKNASTGAQQDISLEAEMESILANIEHKQSRVG